jgi:hypothetical protein
MGVINKRKMEGVREYAEEMAVEIGETAATDYIGTVYADNPPRDDTPVGRKVIVAYNEAGYNCVLIDFEDLKAWIAAHPEAI